MENTNIENIYNEVTDSENNSSDNQIKPTKTRKQIERKALWRWGEDGKYNNKPVSESYFRDYYKEHLQAIYIECPHCKKAN